MKYEILYTSNFEKEFKRLTKKYKSIKSDIDELLNILEVNPKQGVPLGRDCFKIRLAILSKGKGKSGGARVITHIYVTGKLVYLLSIYDKSEKENISDKELEILLKLIQ